MLAFAANATRANSHCGGAGASHPCAHIKYSESVGVCAARVCVGMHAFQKPMLKLIALA